MYKYNKLKLPATFTDCFKLAIGVHPYNTR